jgi:hypothetical protein
MREKLIYHNFLILLKHNVDVTQLKKRYDRLTDPFEWSLLHPIQIHASKTRKKKNKINSVYITS